MQIDSFNLSEPEKKQRQEAIDFVRHNSAQLCEMFASLKKFPPVEKPISVFMAGSPGAGKTELSKNFVALFETSLPVRVDPDDIRQHLPHYNGQNSYVVQSAADLAVEKILDHAFKHNQNFILDTTFAGFNTARKNIDRALNHKRRVQIFYIFKEPDIAWQFTKARELKEGRLVPKEVFIEAFFTARENANKIKQEFGQSVILHYFYLDFVKKAYDVKTNLGSVDDVLDFKYTRDELRKTLI